jgi:hypothetical protein
MLSAAKHLVILSMEILHYVQDDTKTLKKSKPRVAQEPGEARTSKQKPPQKWGFSVNSY